MRKALPWIYLLLALVGAGLTWQANLAFIAESSSAGFELQRFISDASSNPASQSLSRDLLIGATAVSLWMSVEGPRLKIRFWWLGIVLSFSVRLPAERHSFCSCASAICSRWRSKRIRNHHPRPEP